LRWSEQQLADYLAKTGVPAAPNKTDTRRPRDTPIWKLEAALKCRSCKKGR
jgi:hypothetical protein